MCGLGDDDSGERCPNLHIGEHFALHRHTTFSHLDVFAGFSQARNERLHIQAVAVEIRLACEIAFGKTLGPGEIELSLFQHYIDLIESSLGGLELRLGEIELCAGNAVIQSCQ